MDSITKKIFLVKCMLMFYFIEIQKRGLLHANILVILQKEYKLRNSDKIEQFVSSNIPNPITKRELFDIVMIINMVPDAWCTSVCLSVLFSVVTNIIIYNFYSYCWICVATHKHNSRLNKLF